MRKVKSNHPEYSLSSFKPLPLIIKRRGFTYIQLQDDGGYYLYEQRLQESGKIVGCEVFKRKVYPQREAFGKIFPAAEAFPHDEAFGSWAWSYYALEKAKKKLLSLISG